MHTIHGRTLYQICSLIWTALTLSRPCGTVATKITVGAGKLSSVESTTRTPVVHEDQQHLCGFNQRINLHRLMIAIGVWSTGMGSG